MAINQTHFSNAKSYLRLGDSQVEFMILRDRRSSLNDLVNNLRKGVLGLGLILSCSGASDEGTACNDECGPIGKTECDSYTTYIKCDYYGKLECLGWGGFVCEESEYCDNRECVPEGTPCTDECNYVGEKGCAGSKSALKECGYFDKDECLDWKTIDYCRSDYACDEGECVYNP